MLWEIEFHMKIARYSSPLSCAMQFLLMLGCLAACPVFSNAQDAGSDGSKKPLLTEPIIVTVTAQKEPEPAMTIPLSVTAVAEDSLRDANIQAVKQATVFAPNAFINEFSARAVSNPFIRGIGGSPANPGISTVIDGVPQLNSSSSNIEMVDVGQIEFVRGPMGALYGRNTAGGLINITSRAPSNTWTTQDQVEFGNYARKDVRVSLSGPLLQDRFGIALAGGYSSRDGYTVNDFTGRDLDSREAGFGKAQLFFKVTDRLKIRFIYSGEHDNDGDYALGDLDYIRANPNHVSRDFEGFNHRSVNSTTLVFDYHGSFLSFSSISGGVWWRNHALTDLDYQTATMDNYGSYAKRDNVESQHQFTQEFRFSSSKDKPLNLSDAVKLDWQAGIFIFNQGYRQDAVNNISSSFGFFPTMVSSSSAGLGDSGMGIYGKAKFAVRKKLSLTAGLRYDYENKNADLNSSGAFSTSPSDSFSEVSPQFSAAYQFTQNQMSYVSVSRGYKAGGFNPAPTGVSAPAGTESYGAERTWNYELGHKSRLLGDKLEATAAFFYIDWQNLQLNQQIPYSGGQYFIGNAGRANSKGLEVETRYHPFSWWDLFGMVGYTHARFLLGSSAYNANFDLTQGVGGNALPYTPTFNANMGTQVSWAPCAYAKLYFRVQITKYGDIQYDASNAMGQESYQLVNFRGGVRAKHWFAEGWADNAFNAHYVPIAIPYAQPLSPFKAPSGYIGESGAPVTYGARGGINF
jgi:iron complex outermembrane recepter protein